MAKDKICENCRHFVKHYFKDEYGRFVRVGVFGHCKHPQLVPRVSDKILRTGTQCEQFEFEEVDPQENKNTALDKLKHAKLLIRDVMLILGQD